MRLGYVPPRSSVLAAAALFALLATAGCEVATTGEPGTRTTESTTGSSQSRDPDGARSKLGGLTVAAEGKMTGYSREKFPHWRSAGSNCDVRDTVLERDGDQVKLDGCNVVAGTWDSFYDDKVIDSPTKVDIDHMVPLAAAWRSGAAKWTNEERGDFANDLDRPQLFAVSASSNRSKGDQDPSTWKPPAQASWCVYAQDWIEVKSHWKLTVTDKEKAALEEMLRTC
ncbi:HNH endonuclease family protein [Actinoplanes sp. G11-F43]|uniref:HNH endonuclease family protein n=1 Tax=Actinoplanes sp. G11-F43 TaxID=3424130 RepID=UPI003D343700